MILILLLFTAAAFAQLCSTGCPNVPGDISANCTTLTMSVALQTSENPVKSLKCKGGKCVLLQIEFPDVFAAPGTPGDLLCKQSLDGTACGSDPQDIACACFRLAKGLDTAIGCYAPTPAPTPVPTPATQAPTPPPSPAPTPNPPGITSAPTPAPVCKTACPSAFPNGTFPACQQTSMANALNQTFYPDSATCQNGRCTVFTDKGIGNANQLAFVYIGPSVAFCAQGANDGLPCGTSGDDLTCACIVGPNSRAFAPVSCSLFVPPTPSPTPAPTPAPPASPLPTQFPCGACADVTGVGFIRRGCETRALSDFGDDVDFGGAKQPVCRGGYCTLPPFQGRPVAFCASVTCVDNDNDPCHNNNDGKTCDCTACACVIEEEPDFALGITSCDLNTPPPAPTPCPTPMPSPAPSPEPTNAPTPRTPATTPAPTNAPTPPFTNLQFNNGNGNGPCDLCLAFRDNFWQWCDRHHCELRTNWFAVVSVIFALALCLCVCYAYMWFWMAKRRRQARVARI